MSDDMKEIYPEEEFMRVAALVFKRFLSEFGCKAGTLDVNGNTYKAVTIKGNSAHFSRGEIDVRHE